MNSDRSPVTVSRAQKRRALLQEGTAKALRQGPARGRREIVDHGPCPACGRRVVTGDDLADLGLLIDLPSGQSWWHQDCRTAALRRLREEREEGASQ